MIGDIIDEQSKKLLQEIHRELFVLMTNLSDLAAKVDDLQAKLKDMGHDIIDVLDRGT